MDYALKDLLRVRELRKQTAETAVTKARQAVKEAQALVKQRQKELKDYQEWRPKQEQRLFDAVMQKQVKRSNLDDIKGEIAILREKELDFVERVKEAQSQVEAANQTLQKRIDALAQANKDVDKLLEHREGELKVWKREQQLKADGELDEFRVKPGPGG